MSIISDVIESTRAIIQGMGVTLSYIPKQKWTVQYPEEPVTMQPRYRGQHLLHVDELGREKCVACFLCAAACPSECIYIVAKDDPRPPEKRIGVDERYAEVYNIDYGRCIFVGLQSRRSSEDQGRLAHHQTSAVEKLPGCFIPRRRRLRVQRSVTEDRREDRNRGRTTEGHF